jgi:hypothetical protein
MHTTTLEFLDGSTAELGSFPAEEFTDWLGAACMSVADPLLVPQLREVTAADFAAQSPAAILAVAMDEGQTDRARLAALGALRIGFDKAMAEAEAYRNSPERQDALAAIMGDVIAKFNALQVRKVAA